MSYLKTFNNFLWTYPILLLLIGTHIIFTVYLRFPQRKVFQGIRLSVKNENDNNKNLSGFAALATTLAATLGTGNIVGVSLAIALGGPGSVFWCWITGILGMATSYAECYLSLIYRTKTASNKYVGGPMYVIEKGLHKKWLAVIYAICTVIASLCIGCATQANAMAEAASAAWKLPPEIAGIAAAILCGFVIIGGMKVIGDVCSKIVPIMGFGYIFCCFLILYLNRGCLGSAVNLIIRAAFHSNAVIGGFSGFTIQMAARHGIARGLYTNEAGMGSAAIAAGHANTKNPKKQALIQMTATFWDTVIMCAITGLVIVTEGIKHPEAFTNCTSGSYTTAAFSVLPYGNIILTLALIAFAIATLIGWSFFGERALHYLCGKRYKKTYQTFYLVMIFLGAVMSLDLVWEMTDLINACILLPNLASLFLLKKEITY
ncbi:alanine/glycine:cation symporter family protein [[Clostridium] polysaccharolyticum]|uniref:Alanine or glycine:cation symporter, AGCS family n=1 Tax=[Clostridium] polysaccharolyticum TaxID=29364 RepID=A0A1I0FT73_9FIRM|nr:amino acid carrier protein [[Clostridium] polysaccharolyticum]SET61535.1 alanine or glycine:cation symporter, AGCS family [[Clostridium] polysaccharolyticum]